LSTAVGNRRARCRLAAFGVCRDSHRSEGSVTAAAVRIHGATERHQEGQMAETYNGYCVKCKEKRDFSGEVHETNGRRMAKGTCPICGTKMNRILGKA
jgi:hypothetical protein